MAVPRCRHGNTKERAAPDFLNNRLRGGSEAAGFWKWRLAGADGLFPKAGAGSINNEEGGGN
jgi:hypothetical protein